MKDSFGSRQYIHDIYPGGIIDSTLKATIINSSYSEFSTPTGRNQKVKSHASVMSLQNRLRGSEVVLLTNDGRIRGTVAGATMTPGHDSLSGLRAVELVDVWDLTQGCHTHGMQRFDASEMIRIEEIKWRPLEDGESEISTTLQNPSLEQNVSIYKCPPSPGY